MSDHIHVMYNHELSWKRIKEKNNQRAIGILCEASIGIYYVSRYMCLCDWGMCVA